MGSEGRAPAPPAREARGWMREQAGCQGPLRAYQDANLGLGGGEDLLAVFDLVVDRLGGGKKGIVRSFAQQVILQVELVEDISSRGARLDFDVSDLAGAGHDYG